MPTGAWRYRHPLPVLPGMIRVQPIGACTLAEAQAYLAGRDEVERRGDSPEAQRSGRGFGLANDRTSEITIDQGRMS